MDEREGSKEGIDAGRGVSEDFTLLSTLQTIRLGHCCLATKEISPPSCLGHLAVLRGLGGRFIIRLHRFDRVAPFSLLRNTMFQSCLCLRSLIHTTVQEARKKMKCH